MKINFNNEQLLDIQVALLVHITLIEKHKELKNEDKLLVKRYWEIYHKINKNTGEVQVLKSNV